MKSAGELIAEKAWAKFGSGCFGIAQDELARIANEVIAQQKNLDNETLPAREQSSGETGGAWTAEFVPSAKSSIDDTVYPDQAAVHTQNGIFKAHCLKCAKAIVAAHNSSLDQQSSGKADNGKTHDTA